MMFFPLPPTPCQLELPHVGNAKFQYPLSDQYTHPASSLRPAFLLLWLTSNFLSSPFFPTHHLSCPGQTAQPITQTTSADKVLLSHPPLLLSYLPFLIFPTQYAAKLHTPSMRLDCWAPLEITQPCRRRHQTFTASTTSCRAGYAPTALIPHSSLPVMSSRSVPPHPQDITSFLFHKEKWGEQANNSLKFGPTPNLQKQWCPLPCSLSSFPKCLSSRPEPVLPPRPASSWSPTAGPLS